MIYDGLILIEQDIKEMIEANLGRTGLLYRLYSRIKSADSISDKIKRKGYAQNGKQLQDVIGLRIMTYFSEDIDVLIDYFSTIFDVIGKEHDLLDIHNFNPVRINLVCRMQNEQLKEFNAWKSQYQDSFKYIDSTFEIQIRTTLSEGWHEIEHNMRYKCKNEWSSLEDESRMLNGIHAMLDTSDRTLFQLFEEIAYQHYKQKNWTGMLRNKFRLRFNLEPLSEELIMLFDTHKILAKRFFKIERNTIINKLIKHDLRMEISFDNIIFLCNYLYVRNKTITQLTPDSLLQQLEETFDSERYLRAI
ncbi:hypothetical protein [Parabacteroides sp. PF5-9]|uniref:hypothetical protein n=1 Tax=Parabacteroides sp. PF5-9 TaxID=1742404 RepID=UPI002475EA70|nr:hypothetical protein [Parabacteroides sp. PF5-9]MDH6358681.1 putative GTP pyrophosphokinase [Parabacteroides sp. PF5-9]